MNIQGITNEKGIILDWTLTTEKKNIHKQLLASVLGKLVLKTSWKTYAVRSKWEPWTLRKK